MSAINTTISWTDATWNPVRGCSRVSSGCEKCYAMGQAHRFSGPGLPYEGLTTIRKGKVDWTGVARLVPDDLDKPLRWRKPKRVFVNSMSDLFHHSLSNEEIAAVFGVMAACPRHTFQVLTKRPERALEWFEWSRGPSAGRYWGPTMAELAARSLGIEKLYLAANMAAGSSLPLKNVWVGVSIENRDTLRRLESLRTIPASVRFLSLEPLLEDIGSLDLTGIHWVIVGGESGPGARPFHVEWARRVVSQCREAGVPVFVKQLGSRPFRAAHEDETLWGPTVRGNEYDSFDEPSEVRLDDRKGGDMSEWPIDLRVRQFPDAALRAAGATSDP